MTNRHSFPGTSRLTNKHDYSFVFADARAFHCKAFTILVRPGQADNARLGLVVAKKVSKKAVDRNRIKRIIRDSFRRHKHQLAIHDIVVLARPAVAKMSGNKCHHELIYCWQQIRKKLNINDHHKVDE